MASLEIENVPAALLDRLKGAARRNHHSLGEEILARLERSFSRPAPADGDAALAALGQLHDRMASLPPLDDALLDRAKRSGRP
jgi:hypothetical protein